MKVIKHRPLPIFAKGYTIPSTIRTPKGAPVSCLRKSVPWKRGCFFGSGGWIDTMYSQPIPIRSIRIFSWQEAKVIVNTDFTFGIKTWFLHDTLLCFKNLHDLLSFFCFLIELTDSDYPAANHFPNVNYILSRKWNVPECNVIVFFQPLQLKQWLT